MNFKKELVLIGASATHALLLQQFIQKPVAGIRITVLVPEPFSLLPTKLENYISGFCSYDEAHIDIRPLALAAGARLFEAKIQQLDLTNQYIHTNNRPPIKFDSLSIQDLPNSKVEHIENAAEHALFIYPTTQFLENWEHFLKKVEQREGFFRICIVGGQDESIEFLLAIQYRIQQNMHKLGFVMDGFEFHLITQSKQILDRHSKKTQQKVFHILYEHGIRIYPDTIVNKVDEESLYCTNGVTLNQEAVFLFTGITSPQWVLDSDLAKNENGFIQTNSCLQSISHPNIFSSGPLAENNLSNKQQVTVTAPQSKLLYQNIFHWMTGTPEKGMQFKPDNTQYIALGNGSALSVHPWLTYRNTWAYGIKSYRDQSLFSAAQLGLPKTIEEPPSESEAGVRLNESLVLQALNRLEQEHTDFKAKEWLQHDPLSLDNTPKQAWSQLLIHLKAWFDDPYLFGQLAAENCLSHLYVRETQPTSILTTINMPFEQENFIEESLYQLLKGFYQVVQSHGVTSFKGQVHQGPVLSINAAVSGLSKSSGTDKKSQAGECLILTTPLGSGLLLEADRQKRSRGSWMSELADSMLKSNLKAVETFKKFKASQCFYLEEKGLIGNLASFLKENSLGVTLDTDSLPIFNGVQQLIEMSIRAAAYKNNQSEYQDLIDNLEEAQNLALFPIFFDPQMLGGLLGVVPEDSAAICINQLQELGYNHARIIGRLFTASPNEPCVRIHVP